MGFRIVAGARRDFRGSITWYERQAGLGSEFISAVESARAGEQRSIADISDDIMARVALRL